MFLQSNVCRNSFVEETMYSDLFNGAKSFARYLARLYDAVPMFEMIGLRGKSSTSSDLSLCTLAVPYSLPGAEPVGYTVRYSFCEKTCLVSLTAFCIFISNVAVGSFWQRLNL